MSSATQTAELPPSTRKRGLGRIDAWWLQKVGPALGLAYCTALVFHVSGWITLRSVAVVAFVGLCAGSYGYVLNDVFDLEVDRLAGKPNRMAAFSPTQRFLACAAALVLGFAPALFVPTSKTTLLALGLEYLILTVYSVPPIRLKARGILGLFGDASGAHVGASLYVIAVLADGRTPGRSPAVFIGVVLVWQLCLGLIGILVHQVEDRENDRRSGIKTFATVHEFASIRVPFTLVYAGELLAFAALCIVLRCVAPLISVAALIYIALLAVKLWSQWPHYRNVANNTTLMEWWQLSHPFYEAYFPLAAAIQCAWLYPQLAVFVVFHLAVFVAAFRAQLLDSRSAWTRLLLGARLELTETSNARMRPVFFPRLARRIDITASGTLPWEIRAMRPGVSVRSGQHYAIQLKMKASQPRTITIGVWQDHAPWGGLGLYENLALSGAWQTISREFTASEDDTRGYLGLWLGGNSGSLEVRQWSIRPVARAGDRP